MAEPRAEIIFGYRIPCFHHLVKFLSFTMMIRLNSQNEIPTGVRLKCPVRLLSRYKDRGQMLKKENAQKFRMNVRDYQNSDQTAWDLPSWDYPLAQGVMPLCAIINQCLIPVGTAFLISKLGIIATAAHVIHEAVREDREAYQAVIKGSSSMEHSLRRVQLAVLHHRKISETRTEFNVWPLENVQIARPTDIAFGFLKFQQSFPYLSFTLSPAAPRIGETVFCIGYCDSRFPNQGIPLLEIQKGSFDWQSAYSHRFHVAEGKVQAIFVQHFAKGYADGPCFLIDSCLKHGQSGGPVFNSAGNICGINLGGASELTTVQSSLASLIYPGLAIKVNLRCQIAQKSTLKIHQPLINLMLNGGIKTDGSERCSKILFENDEFRVDPSINRDDAKHIYNDFHGYQDSQPALPNTKVDTGNVDC